MGYVHLSILFVGFVQSNDFLQMVRNNTVSYNLVDFIIDAHKTECMVGFLLIVTTYNVRTRGKT